MIELIESKRIREIDRSKLVEAFVYIYCIYVRMLSLYKGLLEHQYTYTPIKFSLTEKENIDEI